MKNFTFKTKWGLLLAVAASCMALFAHPSFGAFASETGASGYSGDLSSNLALRHQELICDPTHAPISGSTSIKYNAQIVSLTGLIFGPGYSGNAFVEEQYRRKGTTHVVLQNVKSFLVSPEGTQTGYIQVNYILNATPGTLSPIQGYIPVDVAGIKGVDTNALVFGYKAGVPDNAIAKYTIYADTGKRPSKNHVDVLTGVAANGAKFTLGPNRLSSAVVRGSLITPTPVPLPPTAWAAATMLLGLVSATAARKTFAAAWGGRR